MEDHEMIQAIAHLIEPLRRADFKWSKYFKIDAVMDAFLDRRKAAMDACWFALDKAMIPGTTYKWEVLEFCPRCQRCVAQLIAIHGEPGPYQIGEVQNFCTCPKLFEA